MAVQLTASFASSSLTRLDKSKRCDSRLVSPLSNVNGNAHGNIHCKIQPENTKGIIVRRSGNYQPSMWDHDYVQSIKSQFEGESYAKRIDELKGEVRKMFERVADPLDELELIDTLQRLGIAYHFEAHIERSLKSKCNNTKTIKQEDFYATALAFRLKRQHRLHAPQDVFISFMDKEGKFKECFREDIRGLLHLYEASFLCVEGESILEDAKTFATKHLEEYVKQGKDDCLSMLARHALELPLHWRVLRVEARWFIDLYQRNQDMNNVLLELAVLDFNMVQGTHQADLRHCSRWWTNTCLGVKLSFARDRLMENFLWTVGVIFEPQSGYCRRLLTKVNALVTTIDDVYDVYGTLDELELFTDAVERWDIMGIEKLPEYMKICFFALYNTINDIAFDALKEGGIHIIPYLKKAWAELCKAYLLEAKWYHSGYTPTLQEYMDNAWISISVPTVLVHAYFFVANPKAEDMSCLGEYHNIIRWSSVILRLADDLGTSSDELKRGDVPKSIQCYMYETGVSEEDAREYIHEMINATWRRMNEDRMLDCPFPQAFVNVAMNLARMT